MNNMSVILKELECPVCLNYMHTEIPMCVKGHSLCKNCKEICNKCPICQNEFSDNKNYSLENIASGVLTSCKNKGCDRISHIASIETHHHSCDYKEYSCPLDITGCVWKGALEDIRNHLESHGEGAGKWHADSECKIFMKIGFCAGEIFRIFTTYSWKKFCKLWSAQYVGPAEKAAEYLMKMEFKDSTGDYNLVVVQPCLPLGDIKDVFNFNKISVTQDMLDYFKVDGVTRFKVSFIDKQKMTVH